MMKKGSCKKRGTIPTSAVAFSTSEFESYRVSQKLTLIYTRFIQEDPGRQIISGSFNPIDYGEWSQQAYMGPTEKLFNAIVTGDRTTVFEIISAEGSDVDRRDHVGRTPLHMAILSKATDIACDLIDAGSRMTARMVGGRSALHLAAQLDLPVVVRKLLERSAVNKERAEEEAKKKEEAENSNVDDDGDDQDSSKDDWSSEDEDQAKAKDSKANPDTSHLPEDELEEPDVFDVNILDWDYAFTPLQYAVVFGSLGAIDELLAAGADATLVTKTDHCWTEPFHPLTLIALTMDVSIAGEMVKKLVAAGASSSQADDDLFTIFHKVVCANRPELVEAFLRNDPTARVVIDSPFVTDRAQTTLPIVSAIVNHNPSIVAVLLAYGAKISVTEEDFSRACELKCEGCFHFRLRDLTSMIGRTYRLTPTLCGKSWSTGPFSVRRHAAMTFMNLSSRSVLT